MQNDNKNEFYDWLGYDSEDDREMTMSAVKLWNERGKHIRKDVIEDNKEYNDSEAKRISYFWKQKEGGAEMDYSFEPYDEGSYSNYAEPMDTSKATGNDIGYFASKVLKTIESNSSILSMSRVNSIATLDNQSITTNEHGNEHVKIGNKIIYKQPNYLHMKLIEDSTCELQSSCVIS